MPAMLTDEELIKIAAQARVLQIIGGALMAGVAAFSGYAWLQAPTPAKGTMLSLVALGFAVAAGLASFAAPALVGKMSPPGPTEDGVTPWLQSRMVQTIIALALLEGPALLNGVALMLEGNAWTLAVIAVLLIVMLIRIPTAARMQFEFESRRFEG